MLHLSFHATITHSYLLTGTKLNLLSGEAECAVITLPTRKTYPLVDTLPAVDTHSAKDALSVVIYALQNIQYMQFILSCS